MYEVNKGAYLLEILRTNPSELGRLAKMGLTTFRFRFLKRCVGSGTIVSPGCVVVNSANVEIGEKCLLQDFVYIRAGAQGSIVIEDRAALNSFCRVFGHGGVKIGEDVQIGPGSLITTTDHDYEGGLETRYKPVVVEERAWIGANVTVLPGVTVGSHSVVGAGSVVTRDVPPGKVVVGAPARVVKDVRQA